MDKKTKNLVIAIKTKTGENLLGFYCGESEADAYNERCVLVYRPVYVHPIVNDRNIYSYVANLYFQYGCQLVSIPYSHIRNQDMASDFFSLFYIKTIGHLIVQEEKAAEMYTKHYEKEEFREIMSNTDSMYITVTTEFTH